MRAQKRAVKASSYCFDWSFLGKRIRRKSEPAVSRVLSWAIIHLGRPSPAASSNLPGSPLGTGGAGCPACFPIWSCSRRGLPCRGLLPVARCALTAPFHPYQGEPWRYIFCGTFHGLAPSRRYLAPCPKEPGLSSTREIPGSDCLADSDVLRTGDCLTFTSCV